MEEQTCKCGHEDCDCQFDEMTVMLTLDNDEELECVVLTIFEAGDCKYIALLPIAEDGEPDEEESDVYLYRYIQGDGEEPTLENIEDEEEYEIVADAFDEWLDMQEFEELSDD